VSRSHYQLIVLSSSQALQYSGEESQTCISRANETTLTAAAAAAAAADVVVGWTRTSRTSC